VKTRKGRGRGWAFIKELLEFVNETEVVTVSPAQRERVLAWARLQVRLEPSNKQALEEGAQHRAGRRASRTRAAGNAAPLVRARRPARRLLACAN